MVISSEAWEDLFGEVISTLDVVQNVNYLVNPLIAVAKVLLFLLMARVSAIFFQKKCIFHAFRVVLVVNPCDFGSLRR